MARRLSRTRFDLTCVISASIVIWVLLSARLIFFFFQAEDGIRDLTVTGVQTCALPICSGPGSVLLGVEHLVQCRAQSSEHTSREPQEQGRGEEREVAAPRDQVAERALDEAELTGLPTAGLGEEAFEQLVDVELVIGELVLGEVADDGQDEPHEGDGREQNVERDGAGEKRNVVFVGGLESAPDDAGDRAVPAAFRIHASGSSSSSDAGAGDTGGLVARARRRRAASSRRRSCSPVAVSGSSSPSSSDSSDAGRRVTRVSF